MRTLKFRGIIWELFIYILFFLKEELRRFRDNKKYIRLGKLVYGKVKVYILVF